MSNAAKKKLTDEPVTFRGRSPMTAQAASPDVKGSAGSPSTEGRQRGRSYRTGTGRKEQDQSQPSSAEKGDSLRQRFALAERALSGGTPEVGSPSDQKHILKASAGAT